MKFPEQMIVEAFDICSEVSVANIALSLEFFAIQRNNYIIGPIVTNESGQVRFTRAQCERSILAYQKMFVMDYLGNLEDCQPDFIVRVHPPACIIQMVQQYKSSPSFWGIAFEDPVGYFAALENVRNSEFEPASMRINGEILIPDPKVIIDLRKLP